MFEAPTAQASPAQQALAQIRGRMQAPPAKMDLGMSQPATTSDSGAEFYVQKSITPDGLKKGDEVYVKGVVSKIGSQVSISPSEVTLCSDMAAESPEVDAAEAE